MSKHLAITLSVIVLLAQPCSIFAEPVGSSAVGEKHDFNQGPELEKRKALFHRIQVAKEQGVGVQPYFAAFDQIEVDVRNSADLDAINSKIDSLSRSLEAQLKFSTARKAAMKEQGAMSNSMIRGLQQTSSSFNSQSNSRSSSSGDADTSAESRKDPTITRARAECDQIMKKADQQIEEEKANSSLVYSYSDGHSGTDITHERKAEILAEAEERCRKIMENAERASRSRASTSVSSGGSGSGQRDGSDLIEVIRNQGSHPAISAMMTENVKAALDSFPPQFVELLRSNRAKVKITPTMIDLFPGLKNTRPRGYEEGHTYQNCPALFKYPNIVVAEYALVGENDSSWQKLDDPVGSMRHEMGHALDAFLGNLTETEEFKHVYYLDLGKIDPQMKQYLSYYTQRGGGGPSEAFAEVFAGLYGKRSMKERQARTDEVVAAFPGLAALIKKKITEFKPVR